MALCLPEPPVDLWNPAWPIRAGSVGGAPAKVVADVGGHSGHVLNALRGDGSCVRGAEVVRCVLGSGVSIEAGAEVEDALLLDGCRIGRGARVRRTIVGVGAVIGAGEVVGYDDAPPSGRVLPSGLTLVPPASTAMRPAAHGR
jgi:glucose-1-phosphate adenylyltransferase